MTQTVVVTGASAGVGQAVAHTYAARGARLALLARGEAGLAAAERECRLRGAGVGRPGHRLGRRPGAPGS
ncbi:SDR family NAD(P)-dependent oxidoreductase [Micromonospora sp. NPDC049230]|uniref:SDR family NAD(P)-dependent oxidoreductase n=1 Tax=Micromonospora sp. NPDC049230 TaxID=3155502 RepID=UPI0033D2086B